MNHIQSPRTDDDAIEQEIRAKGLTAPRVTPADIEANIVEILYVAPASGMTPPLRSDHPARLLTFCVLVLKNGFTVTGESACVSFENFDESIGRKIAYENAKQKIWPLMGYALKKELSLQPAKNPVSA